MFLEAMPPLTKRRHSLKSENNRPVRRSLTALDSSRAAWKRSAFSGIGSGLQLSI
jgi:hypothetical protein